MSSRHLRIVTKQLSCPLYVHTSRRALSMKPNACVFAIFFTRLLHSFLKILQTKIVCVFVVPLAYIKRENSNYTLCLFHSLLFFSKNLCPFSLGSCISCAAFMIYCTLISHEGISLESSEGIDL